MDLTQLDLRRGDVLLLCSDGLNGMLSDEKIRADLGSSEDPAVQCQRLVRRANDAGGGDNVTAIVVRFDGSDLLAAEAGAHPPPYRATSCMEQPTVGIHARWSSHGRGSTAEFLRERPERRCATGALLLLRDLLSLASRRRMLLPVKRSLLAMVAAGLLAPAPAACFDLNEERPGRGTNEPCPSGRGVCSHSSDGWELGHGYDCPGNSEAQKGWYIYPDEPGCASGWCCVRPPACVAEDGGCPKDASGDGS